MLCFKAVKNFSSANPLIEMDWSGFSLPELAMCPELSAFNVRTFTAFSKDATGLGMAFNPVNEFLKGLTIDEQYTIATAFLAMHIEIANEKYTVSRIEELEDVLGSLVNALDDKIDLCTKINKYIRTSNIPISDMKEAGTRPQDTPEMTFVQEEAITITTIAILMKLLCPIMGAFANKYRSDLDNKYRECHEAAIMTQLFNKRYRTIICKLEYYIRTLISSKLKETDPTSAVNGNTIDAMTNLSLDTILVKRFTNVDLYRPDGNVIKYIASCCRSGADSQQQNAAMSNSVRLISDPVEMDKDEGNASRMESESKQSVKTADVPVMIKIAAEGTIKKIMKEEDVDQDMYESILAYYHKNPVSINTISVYLLCTYYGQEIGGGAGIKMLNAETVAKLAAILQIIFARSGAYFITHALTFTVSTADRIQCADDIAKLNGWKSSQVYSECKKMIPAGFGEKEWDAKLKSIETFLTMKTCIYNTAPVIWDILGQPSQNDKAFSEFKELMVELLQFIKLVYQSKLL